VKINNEIDRLRKQIKRLKEREEKLWHNSHWPKDLIKPLLNELKILMPEITEWDDNLLTPMGLMNRVSVFPKYNGKTLYLPFLPGNLTNGKLLIEIEKILKIFPQNSIGGWNGMGKESITVESAEQIKEILKHQMK
jgi:hypothetical protein